MDTKLQIGLAAGGGLVLGGAAGYFIARKALEKKFRTLADEEIASVKESFKLLRKEGEFADPISAAEALGVEQAESTVDDMAAAMARGAAVMAEYESDATAMTIEDAYPDGEFPDTEDENSAGGDSEETPPGAGGRRLHNVFDVEHMPQALIDDRRPEVPYIIHHDEFSNNENDFDQHTLTFYEGDGELVDERDVPISDKSFIGIEHFDLFGSYSRDKNIVYVRNEQLEAEYEIIRKQGTFASAVWGLEEEPDERPARQQRRMRDEDE